MENQEKRTFIFSVFNQHVDDFPYSTLSTHSGEKQYIGYFQNHHGEQWIFIYNDEFGGGVLTGGDVSWEIIPLGNADIPLVGSTLLSDEKKSWLIACWSACKYYRSDEEDNKVQDNFLILASDSYQWKIPYSTLLTDAKDKNLAAKKLGNVWVTTAPAMVERYGKKNINRRITEDDIRDNDETVKQEMNYIREKLSG